MESKIVTLFVVSVVCSCSDDSTNVSIIEEPVVSENEYEQGVFDPSLNLNVIKNDTTIYNKSNYSNILSNTEKEINTSLNNYAVNMMIDYNHSQRNTVISPVSATILYSMMSNFGGNNNQIKKNLNIEDKKKEDINSYNRKVLNNLHNSSTDALFVHKINLKNKMWLNKDMPVYQSFLSTANFYDVGVEGIDFRNTGDISVVKDAILNGNADNNNIFGSYLSDVCSVVTSYLDFSAEWLYKFSLSKDSALFVNADNTTSYCHYLSYIRKTNTKYASFDNFDIIELPYEFSQYSMIVILPHDGASLSHCLNSVKLMGLAHCVESMKETLVNVRIPEFHYRTVLALNNADVTSTDISQMYHTNLSEISPNGFVLDNIYQSCEIEVSSYGTKATAETWRQSVTEASSSVVRWDFTSNLVRPIEFFAFRPFAVFIRDSGNGVIPFAATINTLKNI